MYEPEQLAMMRIDRFVRERLHPALYRSTAGLEITAWEVPDEPVPFADAITKEFEPFSPGQPWGRRWGTVWFHVTGVVPDDWPLENTALELLVDLGFTTSHAGFQAEGLVYSPDGVILKGIEPFNQAVPLAAQAGDAIDLYLEAASNPDAGGGFVTLRPNELGRKPGATDSTPPDTLLYRLEQLELGLLDLPVWELVQDIWTLEGLALQLEPTSARRARIVSALDRVTEVIDPFDVSATAENGREALADVLASPAGASEHRAYAVGHAHIDSAWLWPIRETVRKCARTFSNVLALMDADPGFVFAASSAQQYAWMKEYYPELFERIRQRVVEGRFIPVGGMWVESDTNMPSGESLARQFIEGKKFFIEEFGFEPDEVWLPDSFGYTGALPQIARAAGSSSFLTQKLSWNETNRFPHTSFEWEGIDGTRIFTHFPAVDTYNSDLSGRDLAHAAENYKERGIGSTSLVPFGWGDGGGGPTREMLAAAQRTRSLEGSTTVTLGTPRAFFEAAKGELAHPSVWVGELYLEFHRGTYTSQARTKQGNRRSEALLHEAELWAATAAIERGTPYPYEAIEDAWRTVLLQQFHDILPGSSIGWVYDQAEATYREVGATLEALIQDAIGALGASADPGGAGSDPGAASAPDALLFNASPYPVAGIPAMASGRPGERGRVHVSREGGHTRLENDVVRIAIAADGTIVSVVDLQSGREVIPEGAAANVLELSDDHPTQWDAWDLDKEYRRSTRSVLEVDGLEIVHNETGRAAVRVVRSFGDSRVTQTIALDADSPVVEIETEIDWHEQQKILKLAFPLDIHAASATSEIQFGHLERATHTNTSWDAARFETSAHRWVHVHDSTFGVGIANDSTYGHDVLRFPRAAGGTISVVRQSLVRAPLFPDPTADQGRHVLRSSLVIGGVDAAIAEGYRLSLPLRTANGEPARPLVSSDSAAVVVDTVKLAEDRSGDVIVRLYEAHGSRASAEIAAAFEFSSVDETDLLERITAPRAVTEASASEGVRVSVNPFQLVTLRFRR